MKVDWLRPIEQILIAARGAGHRVVGVTSPRSGSGVSTVARQVAECSGRSGINTLLVDLTVPISEATSCPSWVPGQPGALNLIKPLTLGYDQLTCRPTRETRFLFNNAQLLRRMLDADLEQYATVIVDVPPLLADQSDLLSSVAAAATCDAVCMVCVPGRITRDELTTVSDMLKSARIRLFGIVLNDVVSQTPAVCVEKRTPTSRLHTSC